MREHQYSRGSGELHPFLIGGSGCGLNRIRRSCNYRLRMEEITAVDAKRNVELLIGIADFAGLSANPIYF